MLWLQFRLKELIITGLKPTTVTVSTLINHGNINSTIIGDSIVAGLALYNNVWKYFFGNGFINLDLRGDRVEHVQWRVRNIAFPPRLKNLVILCGTNNINKDPSMKLLKD